MGSPYARRCDIYIRRNRLSFGALFQQGTWPIVQPLPRLPHFPRHLLLGSLWRHMRPQCCRWAVLLRENVFLPSLVCVICLHGQCLTTRQVHDMLRRSHKRQRYQPPTRWRVVQHSLAVYIYSSIVASLSLFGTDVHKHYVATGLACLPLEHNKQSTLFFWLCYFWLLVGIPLFYVIYVWIDVRRKNLIPRKDGRTRSVAFFFLRLTGVFVFMWLPTIIAIYIIAGSSIYFAFLGGTWSHLQPAVSIGVSLLKGDIRQATAEFLTCRCRGGKNEESGDRQRPWERSFRHQQSIFSSFDCRLSSLSTGRRESDIVFSSYEQRPSSVVSTGRKESQDDDFEDNDDDSEKEEAYVPRSSHPLFSKKTDSEQTK